VAGRLLPDPPVISAQSLLLIILDNLRGTNFRIVRVKPDVAEGTSLAQEVPALIKFNLDLRKPLPIGFGVCPLLVQSVFLCDKALNIVKDRLIFDLILHESILQRGFDRIGQALMLHPHETACNRCSGHHVFRCAWRAVSANYRRCSGSNTFNSKAAPYVFSTRISRNRHSE
jgi:hypothetical protein